MKGLYIAPELEIIRFLNDDIVTASLKEEEYAPGTENEGSEDDNIWG